MYLKSIESDQAEQVWNIVSADLNKLPNTWPKLRHRFLEWVAVSSRGAHKRDVEIYPKRFYIVENENDNIDLCLGFASADLVDENNESHFMLADVNDVNISYMTLPKHLGKGVSTFALSKVKDIVISDGHKPVLRIASWNEASMRIAQKCGFEQAGADIVIQDSFDYEPTLLKVFHLVS